MLNLEQIERIKNVDILTDFDKTLIKEQTPYLEVLSYYSFLQGFGKKLNFAGKLIKKYLEYKIGRHVSSFYSLFKGCPVEVCEKVTDRFHDNQWWESVIEDFGNPKVGIVSRNNFKIISSFLQNSSNHENVNLVSANIPEIEKGVYTGNVEVLVDSNNLKDFVSEKDYICGRDEKKFLGEGIASKKLGHGLWICAKRKCF